MRPAAPAPTPAPAPIAPSGDTRGATTIPPGATPAEAFAILARSGGIVQEAKSAPELYHNARSFEARGDSVSARRDYLALASLGGDALEDRVGGERRRHVDRRRVGAGLFHRFAHGIENGKIEMRGAAFTWSDTAYDIGTVVDHLGRVKRTLTTGETLYYDFAF